GSSFAVMLGAHGLELLELEDPFSWSGGLGGAPLAPRRDPAGPRGDRRELVSLSAAGRAPKWYLEAKARDQGVDVIAHSHGGAVLVFALLYGAVGIRNVVTVSTPIRNDMIEHRAARRSGSAAAGCTSTATKTACRPKACSATARFTGYPPGTCS